MPDQLACNIDFYLYIRFFCGFYHEFQTSTPMRWLARLCCLLICASITFCYNLLVYDYIVLKILACISSMEYILYMLISLLKSNKYLLQYYKKTSFIDISVSTYRLMRVCLVGYICVVFLMMLSYFSRILILHEENNVAKCVDALIDFIMWFSMIIGRSPLLFVFVLVYTRVRVMRQTLQSNDFDCRILGQHHPRRYIQMYEAIMDGLEAIDGTVKLQVTDILHICSTRDREEIQKLFLFLKRNPFEYSLWRVVPLNVCSLLSYLSFTVTTVIAILQIRTWTT
ncbi:hypothetical protein O3G_MSEX006850 [Manduca sexta]|uniref:Gustatory receptor 26 n=1 Tax=Manduca sexta TaxID=7130 RepID=A0A5K8B216_MANSE|nr:hypothetical protein O3G_MSEX006850 [Manduca sexta]KAG6450995.1 hypothetical protein O3G_MSEX006850 [Manduca sexta]CUQ99367.1 TPA: Gustatory receptor 26 [Manduca sexta]